MNLKELIAKTYSIVDYENCTEEDIMKVKEIIFKDNGMKSLGSLNKFSSLEVLNLSDNQITSFDLSFFPLLREIDCSLNPTESINFLNNPLLESISYWGIRGHKLNSIDFSKNLKLKEILGGQDGLSQIDLSNNAEIENICIDLSQNLRYIDVKNCLALKSIRLYGCLIPYVDLTFNNHLEHVEINYCNYYKGKADVFGEGYPRPVIFVNEDFNTDVINKQDKSYDYYTYLLVTVRKGSKEEEILKYLNGIKARILSIPVGSIAKFHYEIRELLPKINPFVGKKLELPF